MTPEEREGARDALTRVLAIEGRNALARVELAASELSRFESPPAAQERIETIRCAVNEIDELLGKIDLLTAGPKPLRWPEVEFVAVWERVLDRLAPALSARGMEITTHSGVEPIRVAMPDSALERILCACLRVLLQAAAGESDGVCSGSQADFEVEPRVDALRVRITVAPGAHSRNDCEIERAARIELDVQLAEWGGWSNVESGPDFDRIELSLPLDGGLHD
jgi:hypothetical protein